MHIFTHHQISLYKLVLLFLSLSLMLSSCYDEDLSGSDLGYSYFPVELGTYVTYQVDSTWRDDIIGPVGSGAVSYVLRDINQSTFMDEEGREAIRVERQINAGSNWSIKDVWSRVSIVDFSEQNEENVIFVKHNFPVLEGKIWDGHIRATPQSIQEYYGQANIPTDWNYTYESVDEPYTINGFTFDSTVTVIQIDRPVVFGVAVYAKEVYAKHVGMIHKKLTVFNIQQNNSNPAIVDSIGYDFEMSVIDYGQ